MKTTIDIADGLLSRVRRRAHRRGTTLRAVIEEALAEWLRQQASQPPSVKLTTHTFHGKGLQPGLSWDDFGRIRDLVYEGRGA